MTRPAITSGSPDAAASTASRPTFVTIAKRPSGGRDGWDIGVIWVRRETENFCKGGWTGKSSGSPPGQIMEHATRAVMGAGVRGKYIAEGAERQVGRSIFSSGLPPFRAFIQARHSSRDALPAHPCTHNR